MADVKVIEVKLEMRTLKLTKSLLKQMRTLENLRGLTDEKTGNIRPENVVGWIHGSVLGDDWSAILLLDLSGGDYAIYKGYGLKEAQRRYKQIYLA